MKNIRFLKLLLISILILIICILSYSIYLFYKESTLLTNENNNSNYYTTLVSNDYSTTNSNDNTIYTYEENDVTSNTNLNLVDEEYKGYIVDSKLEIPSINLVTNILSNYSQNGIDTSPSKFFGPSPNSYGNYCIAGHNYINPNMFKNLINVNIGDKVFLTDNINGKYEYEVYEKYKVDYMDISPLIQNTNARELTLITCVNYTDYRLIIKAREF